MYHILIPYDGGAIGQEIGDAIRNILGAVSFRSIVPNITGTFIIGTSGVFYRTRDTLGGTIEPLGGANISETEILNFDASRGVPTAYEFRPVSISVLVCISY